MSETPKTGFLTTRLIFHIAIFMFQTKKCEYDWLNIQVDISNVPMNDGTLFHGMHIHEFGEMTNGCEGMGPHYNPTHTPHGAPWQPER